MAEDMAQSMTAVTYRAATEADLETLAALRWEMEIERHDAPLRPRGEFIAAFIAAFIAETRDELARGAHCAWLAEVNGEAVACVLLIWWQMPPNMGRLRRRRGFVSSVYTQPAYRRQGIARHLMTLLIEHARQLSIHRLILWSSEMGRPLYEDLGFLPSGGLELEVHLK
ncbi:MAG: GNAT family N-acetyltransferase [Ktedonobacterales bacterium]|nr:GNAT family N-acetyltransferase [Ktedonobacterales bacterium]